MAHQKPTLPHAYQKTPRPKPAKPPTVTGSRSVRANGCSDRTIDNYPYALNGFTRFLGERPLSETTADDIIAYQVDVAARGLSDSTVRVATYALRGVLPKALA